MKPGCWFTQMVQTFLPARAGESYIGLFIMTVSKVAVDPLGQASKLRKRGTVGTEKWLETTNCGPYIAALFRLIGTIYPV